MGFNREYIINVAPSSKSCSNHNNCRNLTGRSVMTEGERERVTECWCHAARSWLGSDWSSAWPSAFHITLCQHQLLHWQLLDCFFFLTKEWYEHVLIYCMEDTKERNHSSLYINIMIHSMFIGYLSVGVKIISWFDCLVPMRTSN